MKKIIGKRIQGIRVERGIAQEKMANLLDISTSAYCKLEYGETDLTLTRIKRLAQIFKMAETDLAMRLLMNDGEWEHSLLTKGRTKNFPSTKALEKGLSDLSVQNREMMEKMAGDLSHIFKELELIKAKIHVLEGYHSAD